MNAAMRPAMHAYIHASDISCMALNDTAAITGAKFTVLSSLFVPFTLTSISLPVFLTL